MLHARDRAGTIAWLAGALAVAWGYLWLVRGRQGVAVHFLLGAAFVLTALWGLLRAR
jgi:4-hydroxybenzoate polyprenyltransferase